ncbi:MAG: transglycosylase SLT domain-containing protein [Candidatus Thiodiazotropha endolucinida]|nr:transglycosylase SLT domain-containing protein [Candidatus Thiodiazotropha taylori]MCW4264882.1 transglycosylase SLT domain-containing protein [Candidatus Thiodiazotropha endolucinida]MCG8030611.1 transglycosylase SLT domain-containing protein [Candidatus Thiodiazotropha taylori]MCG8117059.1 transglycosylase SLT domain-containing protein [Candidatus Thiodiazotropha taylori]MCW4301353.1 transglycosylase SLT domain-containing protein [Candidatus Thiodiazotropha endolucinida]
MGGIMIICKLLPVFIVIIGASQCVYASNAKILRSIEGSLFHQVGEKYGIDPRLLYAIALNESGRRYDKGIAPHPYVFRADDGAHYFNSLTAASTALLARLKNTSMIDIGMMQINIHYHPVENPVRLLEPAYNLDAAASYLKETLSSTDSIVIGIGRYHSWKPRRARWYGLRIINTYNNLKILFSPN